MIPDSRAWDVGRGGEGVVRAVIVKGSRVLPIVTEDVQTLASSEGVSANNKECVLAAFKEHDTRTRLAEDMQDLKMLLHAANKCRNAAVVLGFVGLKLGFGYFGYEIETGQSLAVIATVLGAGILASIYFPPDEGEESP